MKFFRNTAFVSCALGIGIFGFPDTVEVGRDLDEKDIRALREWIDTKRQVSLKEVGGDLSLSGEVRTEFQATRETKNGRELRGSSSTQLPKQAFDIEFNLMLDYRTDRTWTAIKIEFDDDAGVFSGSLDSLALERAYWGVRAFQGDSYTFDIEIGRRSLSTIFDSRIEFASFFDGILFRYDHAFEKLGDFYIHTGPFVINDRKNQFGYVGEAGLLNIKGTGFYTKLSVIDWDTKNYNHSVLNDRFRFLISQALLGYRFRIETIKKISILYSAFLWNYVAKRLEVSNFQKANWGGYVGFSIGQLLKQWDWALDVNYQVVAAQAIPDFDVSGVGFGNADRSGFYTTNIRNITGDDPTTRKTAAGQTNYRGFAIRFDLLLTDKLDMQQSYLQSITLDNNIGPFRRFHQYELEFIYSW